MPLLRTLSGLTPTALLALSVFFAAPGRAADILMVVGNANNTVAPDTLGPGDLFVRNYLRDSLGHTVTIRHDTATGSSLRASALASDLVLVVESVTSISLTNKLKATPTPLISYEAFIQDDMGFAASGSPGADCDPGPPGGGSCKYGSVEFHDRIRILMPEHALAAGLTDTVIVYSVSNLELTWGTVAPSAEVVATLIDDTTGAVIYTYQAGDTLFDGTIAAGLRVGFFLEDDNDTGTPNFMTADGKKLFNAAVAYALGDTTTTALRGYLPTRARIVPGGIPLFRGRDALGREKMMKDEM